MRLYLLRAAAAAPLFPIFQINIVTSIYYQAISTTAYIYKDLTFITIHAIRTICTFTILVNNLSIFLSIPLQANVSTLRSNDDSRPSFGSMLQFERRQYLFTFDSFKILRIDS